MTSKPARVSKPGPVAEQTADRLHSAAIHLLRRLRREDVEIGLTPPRASALSVVVFAGPLTLGELAAAEQVRPPTMTRIVAGLEEAGLVRRESDPEDGRLTRIRATPRGTTLLMEGRARRVRVLASQLEEVTAAELAVLEQAVDILERLVNPTSRGRASSWGRGGGGRGEGRG